MATDGEPLTVMRNCFRRIRNGVISFLFNEYFHGCSGAGVGASHQTGWTAVIAKMITQLQRWR